MTDLKAELGRIRERYEAATEGPWVRHDFDDAVTEFGTVTHAEVWNATELDAQNADVVAGEVVDADAEFIAHARTDVPRLVAALEAVVGVCDTAPSGFTALLDGDQVREAITAALTTTPKEPNHG